MILGTFQTEEWHKERQGGGNTHGVGVFVEVLCWHSVGTDMLVNESSKDSQCEV